jgi:acyl transferase domain-containing protein
VSSRHDLLRESLDAIERLQAQLKAAERAHREPIAILGAGCRLPGDIESPESLWRVLRDGVDAVQKVPTDRWESDESPEMSTRHGGFLRDIDRFDADFFGVSPREAAVMDPQQRLLLEVSLEALERAGLAADRLIGSRTGVYVGISTSDYGQKIGVGQPGLSDIHSITGTALNAAAGRIAFNYGFQGPCMAVDTACSSSAVAIHLACQALRARECELALAGAANVILLPGLMALLSKWGALSATGRCSTFDAAADGFVRAEGCAIIVLKRLSDALAAGDPVIGVIRGSAVNSDGRSSGLTVPNGLAQQAVLRSALLNAGLEPGDVDYVEAHGTGTPLGDPIEIEALGAVLCKERQQPLRVGSIKTNLGHGETTAAIAGLLKVVLALEHQAIPPHLHLSHPSPAIPWNSLRLEIPTRITPWLRNARPRRAGVSSFGFSGTNAHLVLEEAPVVEPAALNGRPDDAHIIALSAKSAPALRAVAERYAQFLRQHPATSLADVSRTTLLGRAAYPHRASVVAESVEEALRALSDLASGQPAAIAASSRVASGQRPRIAFMFPGQGSQWPGMLLQLSEREPPVNDALRECEAAFSEALDVPLRDVLGSAELLSQTRYTQPALFAVEWVLSQYWASLDVRPSAVIGHSVGEYVAACVSGVMSMRDGARLVAARGRLMQTRCEAGAMLAVLADEQSVVAELSRLSVSLDIAAINAADSVVVSGAIADITALQQHLDAIGMRTQRLAVSHAFHSRLLAPMLDEFASLVNGIALRPPTLPLYSNLSGARGGSELASADYWVRHVREPVRFNDGLTTLLQEQAGVLLEVGPGTTLAGLARRGRAGLKSAMTSLQNGRSELRSMALTAAELWRAGVPVNFDRFMKHRGGRRRVLPTYPFQRERHWADAAIGRARAHVEAASGELPVPQPLSEPLKRWLYTLAWKPALDTGSTPGTSGSWLILADRGGVGQQLAELLRSRGDVCIVVDAECTAPELSSLLASSPTHVVHCAGTEHLVGDSLSAESLLSAEQRFCGSLLQVAQLMSASPTAATPRLTVLTRGAMTLPGDTRAPAIVSAPVVALARAITRELPRLNCACIDLDPAAIDFAMLCTELLSGSREELSALRGAACRVARLASAAAPQALGREIIEPDATYLITGGLGALGVRVAQRLVERGALHLALLGRHEAAPDVASAILEMKRGGAEIRVFKADVGDSGAMQDVFESISATMPRLRGIVHTAGVLDDGVLEQQSWPRFARVMHPKLAGAWNLHRLSEKLPLQFFVLFSSAAAMLGSAGQSNYCAANAFLDALAHFRRQRGLPAVSIGWGGWAQAGMAAAQNSGRQNARAGGSLLEPAAALDVLQALLADSPPHLAVVDIDWRELSRQFPTGRAPSLFEAFDAQDRAPITAVSLDDWRRSSPAGGESAALIGYVQQCLGCVLGRDAAQIDPDTPLLELGLDSLLAIELRNRIETTGGPVLLLARFLDGADVRRIAALITERLPAVLHTGAPPPDDASLIEQVASMSDDEIEAQLATLAHGQT